MPEFHVHVDPETLRLGELAAHDTADEPERSQPVRRSRRDQADRTRSGRTAATGQSRRYAFRRS